MKKYSVRLSREIKHLAVLDVEVYAESEDDALYLAENNSYGGDYEDEWDHAERYADCMSVQTCAIDAIEVKEE